MRRRAITLDYLSPVANISLFTGVALANRSISGVFMSAVMVKASPTPSPSKFNGKRQPRSIKLIPTRSQHRQRNLFYCSCIFMSVHAPPSRVIDLSILLFSQKQLLFSSQRRFYISQTSNVLRSTLLDRSIFERRRLLSQ